MLTISHLLVVFSQSAQSASSFASLRSSSSTTPSTQSPLFATTTSDHQSSLAATSMNQSLAQMLQGAQTVSMLQGGQLQQFLVVSPSQLGQLTGTQLLIPNQVSNTACIFYPNQMRKPICY